MEIKAYCDDMLVRPSISPVTLSAALTVSIARLRRSVWRSL